MQACTRKNGRLYAVPKVLSLTDRIAARTNMRGNWQEVMTAHKTARVILNYHRR